MDQEILVLGSDLNILSKKMGRPTLQWFPIQLQMENQQKIILVGCIYGIIVDIEGASALANFEVIEIVYDSNPYPTLARIDQAFDMHAVINLKKHRMKFERKEVTAIVPLDLTESA